MVRVPHMRMAIHPNFRRRPVRNHRNTMIAAEVHIVTTVQHVVHLHRRYVIAIWIPPRWNWGFSFREARRVVQHRSLLLEERRHHQVEAQRTDLAHGVVSVSLLNYLKTSVYQQRRQPRPQQYPSDPMALSCRRTSLCSLPVWITPSPVILQRLQRHREVHWTISTQPCVFLLHRQPRWSPRPMLLQVAIWSSAMATSSITRSTANPTILRHRRRRYSRSHFRRMRSKPTIVPVERRF